jgi:hypothetical protein
MRVHPSTDGSMMDFITIYPWTDLEALVRKEHATL